MDTPVAFKKFLTSQYLFSGLLQSFAVLVPSIILFHYGLLDKMILLPLGALFVSQTDQPGPPTRRKNALFVSILIYVGVAFITGLLQQIPWLIYPEIVIVGMFFSLIGVYGNRARVIGTTATLIFIFTIDGTLTHGHFILGSFYILIGGLWYLVLFFLVHKLRPYLILQQLLGENISEIGHYLSIKAKLYFENPDYEELYKELMRSQIKIREQQDILREILFKTREIINESSNKSRILMFTFLDGIDLFERIMTSQQDYHHLHEVFDENKVLPTFGRTLLAYGHALVEVGIAIQSGVQSKHELRLEETYNKTVKKYVELRDQKLGVHTIEPFIILGQIVHSLKDIKQRITTMHNYTERGYVQKEKDDRLNQLNLNKFISKEDYNPHFLLNNLSLKSDTFCHAIRVTVGLLVGYIVSQLLPISNAYWVLMTVVLILKPAYSISRKRNINRMIGTVVGIVLGMLCVYTLKNDLVLFIITMLSMILAYSMLLLNYTLATIGITLYVIISYSLLNQSGDIDKLLLDRMLDTVIGSVIAGLVSTFVLPSWEQKQSMTFVLKALENNKNYFASVASMLLGQEVKMEQFKLYRKDAMISLANLSDNFQKMLSEPKKKQFKIKSYHQFVATSHLMTSYIASLSYYAQEYGNQHSTSSFKGYCDKIERQFQYTIDLLHGHSVPVTNNIERDLAPNPVLNELIEKRKFEIIHSGIATQSDVGLQLSNMQSIQNIFNLINILTIDEIKIIKVLMSNNNVASI